MRKLQLLCKRASLTREATDVKEALKEVEALVVKADCYKAVVGAIPEGILSAVASALSVLIPLASITGDATLTSLLASLKVWIQQKRTDALVEDQERQARDYSYSDWWTA
jgi:hypothetical protein